MIIAAEAGRSKRTAGSGRSAQAERGRVRFHPPPYAKSTVSWFPEARPAKVLDRLIARLFARHQTEFLSSSRIRDEGGSRFDYKGVFFVAILKMVAGQSPDRFRPARSIGF